jgi:hypothetical protein
MRINRSKIVSLFLNDETNSRLITNGYKPSTDHVLAKLTTENSLSLKQQQKIHQIGCEVYALKEAAE